MLDPFVYVDKKHFSTQSLYITLLQYSNKKQTRKPTVLLWKMYNSTWETFFFGGGGGESCDVIGGFFEKKGSRQLHFQRQKGAHFLLISSNTRLV